MSTLEIRLKRLREQLALLQDLHGRLHQEDKYQSQVGLIALQIKALEREIREIENKNSQ